MGKLLNWTTIKERDFESLYFSRFPEISKIIERPSSEHEEKIASAFVKSGYFYFSPTTFASQIIRIALLIAKSGFSEQARRTRNVLIKRQMLLVNINPRDPCGHTS